METEKFLKEFKKLSDNNDILNNNEDYIKMEELIKNK